MVCSRGIHWLVCTDEHHPRRFQVQGHILNIGGNAVTGAEIRVQAPIPEHLRTRSQVCSKKVCYFYLCWSSINS